VIAVLSSALRDRDEEVRATAAWALGSSHGRADASQLVAALDDASPRVRQLALWAIGQHHLAEAPPRVVALLTDDDDQVRLLAAWVLGQLLDRATIPAIRAAFLAETDSDVAQAEFRALLFMGDRSPAVIDRAMSSEDPGMRARGVRMIAGQGGGNWPWPWPWPQPRPSP
jgi:HEAT repeat protein